MRLVIQIILCALSLLLFSCSTPDYADLNPPYTSNEENLANDNVNLSAKIQKQIEALFPRAKVKVIANNFNVLVIGECGSQETKDRLVGIIKGQRDVKEVWNYTTINAKPRLRINDELIEMVQDRIGLEKNINPAHVVVTAVGSTVYLMGTNIGNLTYFSRSLRGIYTLSGVSQVINLTQMGPKDYYSLEKDSY